MSLPLALGTFDEADIPAQIPYLQVDVKKKAYWAARLSGKRSVGLAWRGSPTYRKDAVRSLRLESLEPLFRHRDILYVSLHHDIVAHHMKRFQSNDLTQHTMTRTVIKKYAFAQGLHSTNVPNVFTGACQKVNF